MKKQLNEVRRMQQLAGIRPLYEAYTGPKSKLEKIIQQAWGESDINAAKKLVIDFISPSKIKSKDQIINTIKGLTNKREFDRYMANALLKFEKLGLNESEAMYYVHDKEGMEEPEGPYTLDQAKQKLTKLGAEYNIIDADTAKQIWSYLDDEKSQLNENDNQLINDLMNKIKMETGVRGNLMPYSEVSWLPKVHGDGGSVLVYRKGKQEIAIGHDPAYQEDMWQISTNDPKLYLGLDLHGDEVVAAVSDWLNS